MRGSLQTSFWNKWPQGTPGLARREGIGAPPNTAPGTQRTAGVISILSRTGHLYRELFCAEEEVETRCYKEVTGNTTQLMAGGSGTGRDPGERTSRAQRAGSVLLMNLTGLGRSYPCLRAEVAV